MQPFNPPLRGNQSDSVRLIHVDAPAADGAFAVYSALAKLAVDNPAVGKLPMMQAMRQRAYRTFLDSFEVA